LIPVIKLDVLFPQFVGYSTCGVEFDVNVTKRNVLDMVVTITRVIFGALLILLLSEMFAKR
jgi:hypothetical protein